MLALYALTAGVWLVHVYGRILPTAAAVVVWLALTTVIAAGLYRRARIRRAAFLTAYLRSTSPLERRLRGGWLMAARQLVLAAGLALVLAVTLIRLDQSEAWVVLVAAVPVLVTVRRLLRRLLVPHVNSVYLAELEWRVVLPLVGALLLAALVLIAFHRTYPALGTVSLERAVWHFVDQERARSEWTQVALQAAAALDGLRLWLAQQLMPQPASSLAQGIGWLAVLAEEAVFVWSYMLACRGVLSGTGGQ